MLSRLKIKFQIKSNQKPKKADFKNIFYIIMPRIGRRSVASETKLDGSQGKHEIINYDRELARNAKLNPKAVFRHVNSKLKVRSEVPDLPHDGQIFTSDQAKATALNNYFCSVFTKEKEPIPALQIMPPQQEIADLTITPETVLNLRSCLN
jgi:hypothetical protein